MATDHRVYCADALEEPPALMMGEEADALITDPPYSAKTHAGHNKIQGLAGHRRALGYPNWTPDDVRRACCTWDPWVRGWWVVQTDHLLAVAWADELQALGLYVFPPQPAVIWGSRVRLQGDGPSSITHQIVAARPHRAPHSKWGTLPGAYVGSREAQPWPGGKPLWLMRDLVRDYSRPGDLVWDPCAGAGTTAVACKELDRRSVSMDMGPEACRVTAERLQATRAQQTCHINGGKRPPQLGLELEPIS